MTTTYTVPLGDLRMGIETILAKKDGADYVQTLLDEANRQFALNYPHISTFWDGFERIGNAGGYQLVPENTTDPVLRNINGGTVMGDLFANGAKQGIVWMAPFRSFDPPSAQLIATGQASYAYRALHETFHLARQGGYTDEQMAKAAYSLAGEQPPTFASTDVLNWSQRFDYYLGLHCPRA
jgi:hypothetical protein